jgi:hypothetical protein
MINILNGVLSTIDLRVDFPATIPQNVQVTDQYNINLEVLLFCIFNPNEIA